MQETMKHFSKANFIITLNILTIIIISCVEAEARDPTNSSSQSLPPIVNPTFEFFSGFEEGLGNFRYVHEQGGVVDVIDDPTGSNKGKVLKGTITTTNPGTEGKYRIYPTVSFPFQALPCRVQEDIWMSQKYYDDVKQNSSVWFSHLGLFDRIDTWHPIVTTGWGGEYSMHLNIKGETGDISTFPPILPGAPQFIPESWHTMTIQIDASRITSFYQDNQLIAQGALHSASLSGIEFVHGGPIYSVPPLRPGGYVLIDNLHISCFSEVPASFMLWQR